MKLCLRVKIKDKLLQNELYENKLPLSRLNYEQTLREACEKMDISTPVTLSVHFKHLVKFNTIKYTKDDFIDKEDFEILEVENCSDL